MSAFDFQILILRLKIFSAAISFLFFMGIVYLIIENKFIEIFFIKSKKIQFPKKQINNSWLMILKRVEKNSEAEWKLALIEADKLFDDLLKRMDYLGKDQGERMKHLTKAQFSNINELWEAHKARNRLAHESDFNISQEKVIYFLKSYEKAFKDLALIE